MSVNTTSTLAPLPSIIVLIWHSSTFCSSCLTLTVQGRDCGTAIVPVSMNSFWRENIKTKAQSLGQWVWQMLQLSRKYIHQLFISPNQRTRPWGSDPFVFPPLLPSMWAGRKIRNSGSGWMVFSVGTLVPVISKDSSIKHLQSGTYCLLFPVFVPLLNITKEEKK